MAGVNATETGNEVSQPTLEFTPLTIKAILKRIEIHRATFNAAPLKPLGNARNQRDLDAIERANKVDLISR